MSGFDIFFSILLIVLGVFGGFTSIVRKSRRGQSKFVSFVVSVLFFIGRHSLSDIRASSR